MWKKAGLLFLFFCSCFCFNTAAIPIPLNKNTDFLNILKLDDEGLRDRKLVRYILNFYESKPVDSLVAGKQEMDKIFTENKLENRPAFNYFIEYLYQQRLQHIDAAENALVKAIQLAAKVNERHLLYSFYNELGFLQTFKGNTTEAVYSFSIAKKQGMLLDNPSYQVISDINISDIFYKNSFYGQSLSYLQRAQKIIAKRTVPELRLLNIVYNNIAENYFRVNNIDSLKKYNGLLHGLADGAYKKYIFTKRTDYYVTILQHNYPTAIKSIRALKTDSLYKYDNNDEQNLADSYYNAGMLDSSKRSINRLLADIAEANHPEVKFHLYEVLGKIAEKQNDPKEADRNFKMALQQSEEQISRLTQVDNISSQIKMDEAQDSYTQKEEGYKKERLGLIFVLIIAFLTVGIIAMIFSATRQKRYYERLLYDSKKEELSFIHSHEVRRHLSNLLGLIDLIKNSDDKHKQYLEVEDHILSAAQSLDGTIKIIAEKLNDDN